MNFLILPVENETAMFRQFLPVKKYLERGLNRPVNLKLGHDVQAAVEAVRYGAWDLAYVDPALYCEIRHTHQVRPVAKLKRNQRDTYRSVLVVRENSKWQKLVDIKGSRIALGQPGSSATHLIPLAMLGQVDLSLSDFGQVSTLPNEDEVALSVLVGDHDVGAMSKDVADKYTDVGLRILKASEAIPQFVICAAPDLDSALVRRLESTMLGYRPPSQGLLSFVPVTDREYNILRIMIKNITGRDYLTYPEQAVKLGLLPLYSPITLNRRFAPLAAHLSARTGRDFRLVIPKDFEEFVHIVRQGGVDFAYQNPYVYLLLAREGHLRPLALTLSREPEKRKSRFRGVIITRRGSDIDSIQDLPGRRIMVVSSKSAGGYWFQKLYLRKRGISIDARADLVEGKRQEEVVLSVYRGQVAAGFVRESALSVVRDVVDLDQIRIVATTPYYPNWPLAAHTQTETELATKVQDILIALDDPSLLQAAGVDGFTSTDQEEFSALKDKVEFE